MRRSVGVAVGLATTAAVLISATVAFGSSGERDVPVTLSGLKADPALIEPKQITTISYHVDGDVTLSASVTNPAEALVRNLASDLAVAAGDNTLSWDGLDETGSPVPNGTYTVSVGFTDAAGNSGSGQVSVRVEACRVPRVVGRRLATAKRTIVHAGCSVGTISRRTASKRQNGHVLAQKPKPHPGKFLRKGARIRLWVGSRPVFSGTASDRQSASG